MQAAAGGPQFMMLKPKVVKKILERGMGPGIINVVYLKS